MPSTTLAVKCLAMAPLSWRPAAAAGLAASAPPPSGGATALRVQRCLHGWHLNKCRAPGPEAQQPAAAVGRAAAGGRAELRAGAHLAQPSTSSTPAEAAADGLGSRDAAVGARITHLVAATARTRLPALASLQADLLRSAAAAAPCFEAHAAAQLVCRLDAFYRCARRSEHCMQARLCVHTWTAWARVRACCAHWRPPPINASLAHLSCSSWRTLSSTGESLLVLLQCVEAPKQQQQQQQQELQQARAGATRLLVELGQLEQGLTASTQAQQAIQAVVHVLEASTHQGQQHGQQQQGQALRRARAVQQCMQQGYRPRDEQALSVVLTREDKAQMLLDCRRVRGGNS